MYLLLSKFRFLEFRLLLSRVAPYYSSLPGCVTEPGCCLLQLRYELFDYY